VKAAVLAPVGPEGRPDGGRARWVEADAVALGYGFLPQSELARALGCAHGFDASRGGLVARRDGEGRSSVPEVFIAGDGGGLGGARVALAQGTLAGAAAARDLGASPAGLARQVEAARRALGRHSRFQRALWSLYAAPLLTHHLATPDTLACRCEDVARAALDAALDAEAGAPGALKRASRAGMGRCQGRYCGAVLAALAGARSGEPPAEDVFFAPRTPFKPVPIEALASVVPEGSPPIGSRTMVRQANDFG